MTTEPIIESEMTFGPFPGGQCFYIEKSAAYVKIQQNVPIAEFLLLRTKKNIPTLWVIEAKKSAPNPANPQRFDEFIAEIREKQVNSFSLVWASLLKRHQVAETELPDTFKALNLSEVDVKFVLVVKEQEDAWLPPLHEAFKKAMHSTIKTWAFGPNSVAVMNPPLARRYGLILMEDET